MVEIREDSVAGIAYQRGYAQGLAEATQAAQSLLVGVVTDCLGVVPQCILDQINECEEIDRLTNAIVSVYEFYFLTQGKSLVKASSLVFL